MLDVFADVFEDADHYLRDRPARDYIDDILSNELIAFLAYDHGCPVGAIAAYELRKFEQARSEMYIYDLGVVSAHRRKGVATALIRAVQGEGTRRGAWVTFVQADHDDPPAIALYEKLGVREDVIHFDIKEPGG